MHLSKRILAALLAVIMVLSCSTALFVMAEGETIVVDGELNDSGWSVETASWYTLNTWADAMTDSSVQVKYSVRSDSEGNLYIAVKLPYDVNLSDGTTEDIKALLDGNKVIMVSRIRLWLGLDGNAMSGFYDIVAHTDGTVSTFFKKVVTENITAAVGKDCFEICLPKNGDLVLGDVVKLNVNFSDGCFGANNDQYNQTHSGGFYSKNWGESTSYPEFVMSDIALNSSSKSNRVGDLLVASDGWKIVKENVNLASAGTVETKLTCTEKINNYANSMNNGEYAAEGAGFSYGAPWYSFYKSNVTDGVVYTTLQDPDNNTGWVTYEFSETKRISELRVQLYAGSGFDDVYTKAYISMDGENWQYMGNFCHRYSGGVTWADIVFDGEYEAKYLKVEVRTVGMFYFVSEIEAYSYTGIEADRPAGCIPVDTLGYLHGNCVCVVANAEDEDTTIGALTEKFAGSAKDMNYFAVAIVNEDNVVIDVNCNIGRNVDGGVKTDMVVPVGGYVIGYNANISGYEVMENIKVGDTITLYNIDLDHVRGLEAYESTDIAGFKYATLPYFMGKVPALWSNQNIALGIEGEYVNSNANYIGSLTDGVIPATVNYVTGAEATWRGFNYGTGSCTLDLGEVRSDIGKFNVYFAPANGLSGIKKATSAKVLASLDGESWIEVGEFDISKNYAGGGQTDVMYKEEITLDKFLNARYIKLEVQGTGLSFWAEFEVLATAPWGYIPEEATPIVHVGYPHANTTGTVIMAGDNKTVGQLTEATYGTAKDPVWWQIVAVDSTNTVVEVSPNGKSSADVVCPEGGYILGAWSSNDAAFAVLAKVKVGDTITLYNIDLDEVRACEAYYSIEHAGYTYVAHTHVCGELTHVSGDFYSATCTICGEALYADWQGHVAGVIPVSHHNAYNWGGHEAVILTRNDKGNTLKEVLGYDCTYWNVYEVEEIDGRLVVTTMHASGSDHSDVVIPENGYLILGHSKNTIYSLGESLVGKILYFEDMDFSGSWGIDVGGGATPKYAYYMDIPVSQELQVGDNVVTGPAAGYYLIATQPGIYTFQVVGTGEYTLYNAYGLPSDTDEVIVSAKGTPIYLDINCKGTYGVTVLYSDNLVVTDTLGFGTNENVYVSGEGTEFTITAPVDGRYTITGEGVEVGVAEDYGANWEVDYIDAVAGEEITFVVGTQNWADEVVTLTVKLVDPMLQVGNNTVVGPQTGYCLIATQPGIYTFQVIGAGEYKLYDAFNVYEEDVVTVETKGASIYLDINCKGTYSVIVLYSELPEETKNYLEVGVNENVAVSGEGTEFTVIATVDGRYTISGEGIVVGVMDGSDPNWEVDYIDAVAGQEITFVVATESWADEIITLTVEVQPALQLGDVNGDGEVNALDVSVLLAYTSGNGEISDDSVADINGDGEINTLDVSELLAMLK